MGSCLMVTGSEEVEEDDWAAVAGRTELKISLFLSFSFGSNSPERVKEIEFLISILFYYK